jgi:Holliday junction resolvase RusA-like endonuclease
MTDVTGALLSRQVRREIERKKSKNVVLTVKPDADNILKLGLDALNGVAYADDKQVISCECIKAYAETPQMVITVSEMKV